MWGAWKTRTLYFWLLANCIDYYRLPLLSISNDGNHGNASNESSHVAINVHGFYCKVTTIIVHFKQTWISSTDYGNKPPHFLVIKFHENLSSGVRVVASGQTDSRADRHEICERIWLGWAKMHVTQPDLWSVLAFSLVSLSLNTAILLVLRNTENHLQDCTVSILWRPQFIHNKIWKVSQENIWTLQVWSIYIYIYIYIYI